MKRHFFPFFLACSILLQAFSVSAEEAQPIAEPANTTETTTTADATAAVSVTAEAAILMDAASGDILYEKNADQKMYPASITKLMTILLALENGNLTDEITFSHEAVYSIEPGSAHIAIQEGETLTLEQALRAIILRSANEASNGVAEYVDGSVEAFAAHMTARAKELGCTNTNFVNANGLHDENHYTTAHDMALIAKELLTHPEYRQMMSETYYEIPPTNLQEETRYLHGQHQMLNSNSLYYYAPAVGGKTGYTSEALNTLVTYADQDDMELIAVVLKCNGADHYTDSTALFQYGFENFSAQKLLNAADYTQSVPVTETVGTRTAERGTVTVAPSADLYHVLPNGTDLSTLQVSVDCPQTLTAPIEQGQTVGTLSVSLNGETIQTADLEAQTAVSAMTEEERQAYEASTLTGRLKQVGVVVVLLLCAAIVLLCVTRTIGYLRYQKRKKHRRERRRRR